MVEVDTFGTGTACADDCLAEAVKLVFGLTPAEIISRLDLLTPRYTQTAAYGHFGKPEFPWERTDQAKACGRLSFNLGKKEDPYARSNRKTNHCSQTDDRH